MLSESQRGFKGFLFPSKYSWKISTGTWCGVWTCGVQSSHSPELEMLFSLSLKNLQPNAFSMSLLFSVFRFPFFCVFLSLSKDFSMFHVENQTLVFLGRDDALLSFKKARIGGSGLRFAFSIPEIPHNHDPHQISGFVLFKF